MDKDKDFLFLGPQFPQQITGGGCELEVGLDNPAVLPISGCMTQGCCWWGLLCRDWEWQSWGAGSEQERSLGEGGLCTGPVSEWLCVSVGIWGAAACLWGPWVLASPHVLLSSLALCEFV